MGQRRLQPLMGAKRHHLNINAAYMGKLLIWALSILLPFLLLFCIFPSGTSLFQPSYNRILVSQLQVPTSRVQSDVLEPELSSDVDDPANDEKLPSNDNDHNNDDHDDDSTPENVKKQSNPATAAENSGIGNADSEPKAANEQSNSKETEAFSIEVDPPPPAATKAKKQNHEKKSESLSLNEDDHSSSKAKKQSDGDEKETESDGDDKRKQSHGNIDKSDASPTKAKKLKDREGGDHDISIVKATKQSDAEEQIVSGIDDELNLSSKKTKEQSLGDGDDEPEINEFKIEEGQNGELKEETQKKKKNEEINAESETKKSIKKGKRRKEMPEVELGEALSISGKEEADQPNIAHPSVDFASFPWEKEKGDEAFSSSKKSKLKKVDDDFDDGEEDFSSGKKSKYKTVNNDFDNEEEAFFSSKTSKLKKGNNNFYDAEEEDRPSKLKQKREKDGEPFRSSTYDEEANILEKDEYEARSTMANKKRKQSNSSKKLHDAYVDGEVEQQLDDVENYHEAKSFAELDEVDDGMEEAPFLGNRKIFNKKTKNTFNEREDISFDQKHEDDSESFESSPYKLATRRSLPSSQKDESKEFLEDATTMPKRKKQKDTLRTVESQDLNNGVDEDKSHIDEASVDDPIISKALPLERSLSSETCNYSEGRWTMDSKYPSYKESTCPWKSINDEQSCKTTKKTSAWRWKPNECSLKRFRAKAFLKLMQGKSVAFIGDKMVKAQLKSLVCLLAEVETPNLLYNDKINESMSWHFSSSNITVSLILSPYLVQQTSEGHYSKLQLDKLDTKWAEMVPTLDVLVLGVGTQFAQPTLYKVKDDVVGCYSCQGLSTHIDITNLKEISLYSGFRATMRSSIMGIGALPGYNGIVMFLQPFGFEGIGSYYGVSLKMKNIQEQELKKAHSRGSISNLSRMEVMPTYLNSGSNFDPLKGLFSPTCLIPSPLADMWNQVLQHTLTRIFTLESDS